LGEIPRENSKKKRERKDLLLIFSCDRDGRIGKRGEIDAENGEGDRALYSILLIVPERGKARFVFYPSVDVWWNREKQKGGERGETVLYPLTLTWHGRNEEEKREGRCREGSYRHIRGRKGRKDPSSSPSLPWQDGIKEKGGGKIRKES